MVKAKDFWGYLCVDLEYRFFAGVACPGLLPLYKSMDPEIMHYVPAVNERVALGLVSGVYAGGFKGGLLLDLNFMSDIQRFLNFNYEYKIPFIIIGYGDNKANFDIPTIKFNKLTDLKKADKMYEKELTPILINIKEGVIS